tara:strand:+ start:14429 stop:14719 length:291 start_codon:yes stop_codon:yes gene_type:complete
MIAQTTRAILLAMVTLATRAGLLGSSATSRGSAVAGLYFAGRISDVARHGVHRRFTFAGGEHALEELHRGKMARPKAHVQESIARYLAELRRASSI